ncbi:hypothetical protein KUW09_25040 [Mameliella alba]|nr:hypothetical protein [Antarctobacter heliothermus]MBY6147329.1 hypothetical protein [Mameliella alba]MCA0957393.1 hypothetical protein [Mameliella alba]
MMFWKHLANARLIEGSFTGIAGSGGTSHGIAGQNIPSGRMSSSAWHVFGNPYGPVFSSHAEIFDQTNGYFLLYGATTTSGGPAGDIMRAEEAWNIDKKVDDRMPGQGKITARDRADCAINSSGASPAASEVDATYNLSNSNQSCALLFKDAF